MDYLEHVAKPGDRWDLIAHKYYGDASLISPIIRANLSVVGSPAPLIFEKETTLRIPVLPEDEVAQMQLPPWKRQSV